MSAEPPVLAVTVGDPLGIGPEVVAKTLARGGVPARVLVLGDARALARDGAGAPPRGRAGGSATGGHPRGA